MTSRGIRNNNPGNIDRNATKWQGMADDQSSDPRFVVFKAPVFGIRALAKTLLAYQNQHGCRTIRQIINRWAPPNENKTEAYIQAVAHDCGVGPDDTVSVDQVAAMLPLVKAIITHENGEQPYPDSLLLEGLHMAGVSDAAPKPLKAQNSFQAHAGAAVAMAAAGATEVAKQAPAVKGWADQLSAFTGSPIIEHAVTVLLTVAGGLTILGIAAQVLKQRSLT
jgi:hypothetical protein